MSDFIYGIYTQEMLDAEYNTRALTPTFQQYVDGWKSDSADIRARLRCHCDLAYGPSDPEKLDVFPADRNTPAPVQMFFHGGGWRSMDKETYSYIARAFHRHGAMTVIVNYALCPSVTIDELVRQCRESVVWTFRNAARFGGDNTRIFISGHSAGAHVAAMMATTDWKTYDDLPVDPIKGVTAISGLYELEAVRLSSTYSPLGFSQEQVVRNSPVALPPPGRMPYIVALGAHESREFHRQSQIYFEFLRQAGIECTYYAVAGHHHYSVLDAFENERHPLGRAVLRQMGLD